MMKLISTTPDSADASAGLERMQFMEGYPDLLTVKHLCGLTGLSEQTIRAEINAGKLPGCRIGRRLYVSKAAFQAFVERGLANG